MRRLVVLFLIAGTLAACSYEPFLGGAPDTDPSMNPEEPVVHEPGSPDPSPDGPIAIRVTPDPAVVDAHPVAVDHFEIGSDGVTVVVYFWGGNETCFGLQQIEVALNAGAAPVMTILEGTRPEAIGQACDMMAVLKSAIVTLGEPVILEFARTGVPPGEPEMPAGAQVVEPQSGIVDPIPVAVTGYHLTADGLTLSVHFYGGVPECYGLAEASLTTVDWPRTVVITEGRVPGSEVCIEIALAKVVVFSLDTPLVVDGSQAD